MATVVWLCFGLLSLRAQAQTANVEETVPPELQKLDEEYIRLLPPIDNNAINEFRKNGVAEEVLKLIKEMPPGWFPQTKPRHVAGQDREAKFPMPYYSGSINRFSWILNSDPVGTQTKPTDVTQFMWETFRWLCGPTGAEEAKKVIRLNLDQTIGERKRICLEAAFRDSEYAARFETEALEYIIDPAILNIPGEQAKREHQVNQLAWANPTNIRKALIGLRALRNVGPNVTG